MEEPGSHLKALDGGRKTRRLTTILVADICGYSRMSEKDQDAAIRTADLLFKLFEDITARHGGRVFKRIADGFLAEYPSARSGMQAALDYAKDVKARNNLAPNAINADIRAGIHVGDVTDRPDGDILGHGVNVAARLQELADPGTILASSNIMNLTRKDIPFKINKRTGLALKNIDEPMTAFQIDPEKSGGGFDIQIPKIFKSKSLLYTALAGVVMYGAMTVQGQRAEAKLEEKIRVIVAQTLGENSNGFKNQVSEDYYRQVVSSLAKSNIPIRKASFELLEKGHVGLAIEGLEKSLRNDDLDIKSRREQLHIIAALSYHYDPKKARANYEAIVLENPEDKNGLLWLYRIYNHLGDAEAATRIYNTAIANLELDLESQITQQIDMAFTLLLRGENKSALSLYRSMKSNVESLNDERILIRWMVDTAFALERLDNLQESEAMLVSAVSKLNEIGADTNLPRALNILGLISEKNAKLHPGYEQQYLKDALKYYEKQYLAGVELNKRQDQAGSLHYQGRIRLLFGDDESALENFSESFRIAREDGFIGSEFKARLGFAQVEHFRGNQEAACKHVRGAKQHFEKKMGPNLGPTSRQILDEIGCG